MGAGEGCMKRTGRLFIIVGMLGVVLLLCSCGGPLKAKAGFVDKKDGAVVSSNKNVPLVSFEEGVNGLPEEFVDRFEQFWTFWINRDYEKQYEMESPHTRYQVPLKKYLGIHKKAQKITKLSVINVEEEGHLRVLRLKVFFGGAKSEEKFQIMHDYWVELDNEWFHVYRSLFAGIR